LYFCWTMSGLIIWLSWIDDCLVAGNEEGMLASKEQMKARFDCDDIGELTEYVGCKVERTKDYVRFTQPVLLQSYVDEFSIKSGRSVRTPAETGKVLVKGDEESQLKAAEQTVQMWCGKIAAHDALVQTGNLQLGKRTIKIHDNWNHHIACESHEKSHGVLCCNQKQRNNVKT
jgi:hypothetical protein